MMRCVSKYVICDIKTIVNIKDSFTISRKCYIYIHTIFAYISAPHLINSKCKTNHYAVHAILNLVCPITAYALGTPLDLKVSSGRAANRYHACRRSFSNEIENREFYALF